MVKLYELKKGDIITTKNDEILEFVEIRGDKAIFFNEWGIEIEFDDFLYADEIGELKKNSKDEIDLTPSLF